MSKRPSTKRQALQMDDLVASLRQDFQNIPDHRAANTIYQLDDILMSAYAMFALKYPSLLCFEQQNKTEQNNLAQLFGIKQICSDAQMRRVLDEISPQNLQELFPKRFSLLQEQGLIHNYRFRKKHLLVSIDGVQYFQSKKIKCQKCQQKVHRDKQISYSHAMLAAVLVHPNRREVFPLAHEDIQKQDGKVKNDCELNAVRRLFDNLAQQYENQPFVLVEDALFSNSPHIELIKKNNWDFILSVKPKGHEAIFKCFNGRKKRDQVSKLILEDGKTTHHFFWMNNILLNGSADTRVNFLHYEEHKNGKVQKFSWVTSFRLRKNNVYDIMQAGRSRWKIENETFNTLKNQGYHFEHNYGHGYLHLCNILAGMMLLAFFIDQLIQAGSENFRRLWKGAQSKARLWFTMRALFTTAQILSFKELWRKIAILYEVQLE